MAIQQQSDARGFLVDVSVAASPAPDTSTAVPVNSESPSEETGSVPIVDTEPAEKPATTSEPPASFDSEAKEFAANYFSEIIEDRLVVVSSTIEK